MTKDARETLVPTEQTTVVLYDREIVAVRLPDGRIAAVFSSLCDALHLARAGQLERVQGDEILHDQLLLAEVATAGGPQAVNVLTAWAIPVWLQGVQLKRVAEDKRPAILAFKREAADVLYRHFAYRQPLLSAPSSVVPTAPTTQPTTPESGAPPAEWLMYHRRMVAFLEWQADVEAWRLQFESRLESVEEVARLVPEILDRLGPQPLTTAHQATVQASVKRLHELTGKAYGSIYGELNQAFHVGKYSEIPDNRWSEVVAWFQQRIASGGKVRDSGDAVGS